MSKKPSYDDLQHRVEELTRQSRDYDKIKNKLEHWQKRYARLIENFGRKYIFYIHDPDRVYSFLSPSVKDVLGFTPDELIDNYFTDNPVNDAAKEHTLKSLEGKRLAPFEVEAFHRNGSKKRLEISELPVFDKTGNVTAVEGVAHDITERKRTEKALKNQKESLEALYKTSLDLVSRLDLDELLHTIIKRAGALVGTRDGFIYLYNSDKEVMEIKVGAGVYEKAVGYQVMPGEGLAGKVWEIGQPVIVKDYRTWPGRIDNPLFDDLRSVICIPLKSGFEVTGAIGLNQKEPDKPFETEEVAVLSRFAALASIALDNAYMHAKLQSELEERKRTEDERRKLEERFHQAQKMEAVGTLAGGLAHDFNNILMAMQGTASIMLLNMDPDQEDYKKVRNMEKYIRSGAELTNQLLGFAKGGKYEVRPTDINLLSKKISGLFGRTKKEIKIQSDFQKDIWTVEVDRGQIEQVLLNLFVNAWQAMPEGGTLYLNSENVVLDTKAVKPFDVKPGKYAKLSVTDTGIGMDRVVQQRIFDPFFTTKALEMGTGLGLASAYGIIKNHKGMINVYSEPAKGTTFNIYLPASQKDIVEDKSVADSVVTGSENILFVDDEPMIIEIGRELLEELGYQVFSAESGEEAVRIFEQRKDEIDIVILDMVMPEMGGGETYDRLAQIEPDVKVILSSGYSINGQASAILSQGCRGFIQKPINIIELSKTLREILDKKSK